jgi:hypothetical protein
LTAARGGVKGIDENGPNAGTRVAGVRRRVLPMWFVRFETTATSNDKPMISPIPGARKAVMLHRL